MNARTALPYPPQFTRTITEVHGPAGAAWLEHLPALMADYAERWALTVLPPFPNLTYNYVAPALRADGTEAVLKLGVPNPELLTEAAALRVFAGRGCVQLLEADAEHGALLLERLQPGATLTALADDVQATSIAASVMRQLWRPAPAEHPFPTIARWAAGFQRLRARYAGGTGPLPARLVDKAERLFAELIASQAEPRLLHGDLHHDNILSARRRPWLALDPKGLVGEPACEIAPLLYNVAPHFQADPQPERRTARRLCQLADALGLDRQRVQGWSFARTVLSAWWIVEDHGYGWEATMAFAEQIEAVSPSRASTSVSFERLPPVSPGA